MPACSGSTRCIGHVLCKFSIVARQPHSNEARDFLPWVFLIPLEQNLSNRIIHVLFCVGGRASMLVLYISRLHFSLFSLQLLAPWGYIVMNVLVTLAVSICMNATGSRKTSGNSNHQCVAIKYCQLFETTLLCGHCTHLYSVYLQHLLLLGHEWKDGTQVSIPCAQWDHGDHCHEYPNTNSFKVYEYSRYIWMQQLITGGSRKQWAISFTHAIVHYNSCIHLYSVTLYIDDHNH